MANSVVGTYCRRIRLKDETIFKNVLDSKGKVISLPVCDNLKFSCSTCDEAVNKAQICIDKEREKKRMQEEADRLRKFRIDAEEKSGYKKN